MIASAERTSADTAGAAAGEVLPYLALRQSARILDLSGTTAVVDRGWLVDLLRPMLLMIDFDEDYYRAAYSDLAEAEARGELDDLHAHYIHFGFFEHRLPRRVPVDAAFYARTYPDVGAAILEKRVASCQVHFETSGFAEGRLPRKGWRFADLLRDPSRRSADRPPGPR